MALMALVMEMKKSSSEKVKKNRMRGGIEGMYMLYVILIAITNLHYRL